MNNNLYQWDDEQMVRHEMGEVNHAIEDARLLREAGRSRPSLLARAAKAVGNLLKARGETTKATRSLKHDSHQSIQEP